LTVRLRDLIDGPKFIHRIHTEPIFAFSMKSSSNLVVGAIVVTWGTSTLYT
jgi:hypothetical protein